MGLFFFIILGHGGSNVSVTELAHYLPQGYSYMSVLIHIMCIFGGAKMPEVHDAPSEGSIFDHSFHTYRCFCR